MDFELHPEEAALAEAVAGLLSADDLPDISFAHGAPEQDVRRAVRAWLPRLGAAGLLDPAAAPLALLQAEQALAERAPWLCVLTSTNRFLAGLIAAHGSERARADILPGLIAGAALGAVAFSEPGMGARPARIQTRADGRGEDHALTGEKGPATSVGLADVIGVLALGADGPIVLLVPGDAPGLTPSPRIRTLGYDALLVCTFALEGVAVPAWRGLALDGVDPFEALQRAEDDRASACALGIAKRCLTEARAHADRPRPDGHGKPPAGHQAVRFRLAEMLTLIQTAELLAQRAAAARADQDAEADDLALCAKVFATEMATRVSDLALEITASAGYLAPNPIERAVRDARLGAMSGHSSDAARMAIADRALEPFAP